LPGATEDSIEETHMKRRGLEERYVKGKIGRLASAAKIVAVGVLLCIASATTVSADQVFATGENGKLGDGSTSVFDVGKVKADCTCIGQQTIPRPQASLVRYYVIALWRMPPPEELTERAVTFPDRRASADKITRLVTLRGRPTAPDGPCATVCKANNLGAGAFMEADSCLRAEESFWPSGDIKVPKAAGVWQERPFIGVLKRKPEWAACPDAQPPLADETSLTEALDGSDAK
jgi:hypothetical protein